MSLMVQTLSASAEWKLFEDSRHIVLDLLDHLGKNHRPVSRSAFMGQQLFCYDLRSVDVLLDHERHVGQEVLSALLKKLEDVLGFLDQLLATLLCSTTTSHRPGGHLRFQHLEALRHGTATIQEGVYPEFNWDKGTDCLHIFNKAVVKAFSKDDETRCGDLGVQFAGITDHATYGKESTEIPEYGSSIFRTTLLNHLQQVQCKHGSRHKLRIQVFPGQHNHNAPMKHRMFLSRCQSPSEWGEIMYEDADTGCGNHFDSDDVISSLCEEMEQKIEDTDAKLKVSVYDNNFVDITTVGKDKTVKPPRWPIASLDACLEVPHNDAGFFHRDKYMLIINIGRCFLWLYDAELPVSSWQADKIFFSCTSGTPQRIWQKRNPFVSFDFHETTAQKQDCQPRSTTVPTLVLLAKLIVEVCTWKNLKVLKGKKLPIVVGSQANEAERHGQLSKAQFDGINLCLKTNRRTEKKQVDALVKKRISQIIAGLEMELNYTFPAMSEADYLTTENVDYFGAIEEQGTVVPTAEFGMTSNDACDGPDMDDQTLPFSADDLLKSQTSFRPQTSCFPENSGGHLFLDEDDISSTFHDPPHRKSAEKFLADVGKWNNEYFNPGRLRVNRKIKVAILDTGVDPKDPRLSKILPEEVLKSRASHFVGDTIEDENGHGTHVAALIAQVAPTAAIYVAKIAESTGFTFEPIVKAIHWAIKKKVNIITMSWGFRGSNDAIEKAIDVAASEGIILFAAAANCGGNGSRSFPANTNKVIAIHASDGMGNSWDKNPTNQPNSLNFTTLGWMITSEWRERITYLSGTSFSTPIAAGFAANILTFARHSHEMGLLNEKETRLAFKQYGMVCILHKMSELRGGYNYVFPCRDWWHDGLGEMDQQTQDECIRGRIKEAFSRFY